MRMVTFGMTARSALSGLLIALLLGSVGCGFSTPAEDMGFPSVKHAEGDASDDASGDTSDSSDDTSDPSDDTSDSSDDISSCLGFHTPTYRITVVDADGHAPIADATVDLTESDVSGDMARTLHLGFDATADGYIGTSTINASTVRAQLRVAKSGYETEVRTGLLFTLDTSCDAANVWQVQVELSKLQDTSTDTGNNPGDITDDSNDNDDAVYHTTHSARPRYVVAVYDESNNCSLTDVDITLIEKKCDGTCKTNIPLTLNRQDLTFEGDAVLKFSKVIATVSVKKYGYDNFTSSYTFSRNGGKTRSIEIYLKPRHSCCGQD